jgi:hypothetical protein
MPDIICTQCGKQCNPGEDWPGDNGRICQMCWESYCSRLWWDEIWEILTSPEAGKAIDQFLADE